MFAFSYGFRNTRFHNFLHLCPSSQSVRDATLAAATAFGVMTGQPVLATKPGTVRLLSRVAFHIFVPASIRSCGALQNGVAKDNPWNLETDRAMDLVKAICAAVLFRMLKDEVRTTGSFYKALQKHISSEDTRLQVTHSGRNYPRRGLAWRFPQRKCNIP